MFGLCSSQRSPSSMFLLPFQCSSPIWTSAAITLTSSSPPDSDVIPESEVDTVSAQCRQELNAVGVDTDTSGADPDDDCRCSDVDVMTSRPNSVVDDDVIDDVACRDDVSATSSAMTSPSKELKFGIDRILIKDDGVKDTSQIGIEKSLFIYSIQYYYSSYAIVFVDFFVCF